MAQIGYGYGSEFQLLRFLGHHRNLLEEAIRKAIIKGNRCGKKGTKYHFIKVKV